MTARNETLQIGTRMNARGISIDFEGVNILRRAEIVLNRWGCQECGDGDSYRAWSIERDETTGIPYMCIYPNNGPMHRYRIADREAGALRRVAAVCKAWGMYYYHQTDPRGCSLYVSKVPLDGSNYTEGVSCCI